MASPIGSLCNGAVSRARLFQSQGVSLKFPARSRSGVRDHDGVVVFAMDAVRVRIDAWGCSCLLWAPARRSACDARDWESHAEQLSHCKLARRCGMAEGFLLYGADVPLLLEAMLSLRVLKAGEEYWAKWGGVARAMLPGQGISTAGARL